MWWGIWVVRRSEYHGSGVTVFTVFGVKKAVLCCYEYPCLEIEGLVEGFKYLALNTS